MENFDLYFLEDTTYTIPWGIDCGIIDIMDFFISLCSKY